MALFKGEHNNTAYSIDFFAKRIRYGAPADSKDGRPDLSEWQDIKPVNGSLVTSMGDTQWRVAVLARDGSGYTGFLLIDAPTALAIRRHEEKAERRPQRGKPIRRKR